MSGETPEPFSVPLCLRGENLVLIWILFFNPRDTETQRFLFTEENEENEVAGRCSFASFFVPFVAFCELSEFRVFRVFPG